MESASASEMSDREEQNNQDVERDDGESRGDQEDLFWNEDDQRFNKLSARVTENEKELLTKFKEAKFQNMKKYCSEYFKGLDLNDACSLVLATVSKVYLCELIEEARTVMREKGETGPMQPKYVHEAYRRLSFKDREVPYTTENKKMFLF